MSEKVHSKRWARKLKNYWIRRPLVFVQCVQTWRDCTYPDICTHYARLTIPLWHCQWMTRVTFGPSNDAWKYTLYTGWTRPEYVNMTGGTPRQHNCHNSIRAILAACKEGSQQLKYCMKGSLRHESGGSVKWRTVQIFSAKRGNSQSKISFANFLRKRRQSRLVRSAAPEQQLAVQGKCLTAQQSQEVEPTGSAWQQLWQRAICPGRQRCCSGPSG